MNKTQQHRISIRNTPFVKSCAALILSAVFSLNLTASNEFSAAAWQLATQGEHRSSNNIARNSHRHPQQTLEFFDLKPSSTVVEIWPSGGWYTEVLAPLLKDKGHYYAAHWPLDGKVPFFNKKRAAFDQKLESNTAYANAQTVELLKPTSMAVADNSADIVFTFRNVHNWMKAGSADFMFNEFYRVLKPGGILAIVEHRAKAGTSIERMIKTGYVTEAHTQQLAKAAGFAFVSASEVNANHSDRKDYAEGVWALPPSLRGKEHEQSYYLNIGESDRMTLKFKKP